MPTLSLKTLNQSPKLLPLCSNVPHKVRSSKNRHSLSVRIQDHHPTVLGSIGEQDVIHERTSNPSMTSVLSSCLTKERALDFSYSTLPSFLTTSSNNWQVSLNLMSVDGVPIPPHQPACAQSDDSLLGLVCSFTWCSQEAIG